jgi:hypothetical protein
MANKGHLKKLKQGVKAWNEWRAAKPDLAPDLREADLDLANLTEAHLREANLGAAYLTAADLSRADLSRAAWHSAFPRARCLCPMRASGRNHRRQMVQGRFAASGMVIHHHRTLNKGRTEDDPQQT